MPAQLSTLLPNFAGFTISRGAFHLRLLDRIGSGAYGVVHLAQDISPRTHRARYYAVKCLPRYPDNSDLQRQQRREVDNHRDASEHPNVVTLHAIIEEEFYTFLVLDLVDGGDLFSAIIERNTYTNNDAAVKRTFLQIIDALDACHGKGIAHRDLKPENILCSKDNQEVYLSDFGLSTRTECSTNFGCGSSFYISPECLGISNNNSKTPYLTKPSDVWALGTILCNLLTSRNPWHIASPTADEGFQLYLREGPSWLLKSLPISPAAADILGRIFEVDPSARITLPSLRAAVLAADTFFPTAVSPASSSYAHIHIHIPIPATSAFSSDSMSMSISHAGSDSASASASATLAGTSRASAPASDTTCWTPAVAPPPGLTASPHSSDMGDESDGPSTPETHPAHVANTVSEYSLDASVSSPHSLQQKHVGRKMDKMFTHSLCKFVTGVRARGARIQMHQH